MRLVRRWWWAMLLVAVVLVRIALPSVVRAQIERRASEALRASVTVGNIDLALLGGGVALEKVAVREAGAAPDAPPLIAWERLAVRIRWLPLFRRTVRLASVELISPHLALDRLQSGNLNLAALMPAKAEEEAPPEAQKPEEPGEPWGFGIDYVALRRGDVQFRDLLVPGAEPVSVALELVEIDGISFAPGVYDDPADIRFAAKLDQGVVRTRARFRPRKDGIALDLTLAARRLPVKRSRVYVPNVAWTQLSGLLSLGLRYRLETGGRNEVSGTVALDDLQTWVAGLEEPALGWKSLRVKLDRVDLAARNARVAEVRLAGALLPVHPSGDFPLPLLSVAREAAKAAEARHAPKPASAETPPAPTKPWTWSVASAVVADSQLRILSDREPLAMGVALETHDLSEPPRGEWPLRLDVTLGDGKVAVDGAVRLEPLAFTGRVQTEAWPLPEVVAVSGAVAPDVLQVGTLTADLQVTVGGATEGAGDVQVSGRAAVDRLWLQAHDPNEFAAGAARIEVDVDKLSLPAVLAPAGAAGRPYQVDLARVHLAEPYARITRTADGIALPSFTPPPREGAVLVAVPAGKGAASPGIRLVLDRFTTAKGHVDITDRTVSPFYWGALTPIDAELQDLRWPEGTIDRIAFRATSPPKGLIEITGRLAPDGTLELTVKDLPLAPFNPYVTAASPYSIANGVGFVTTKVKIRGNSYETTTALTLWNFDLASRTGQHVVLEQLGVPLTVALALLKDWNGNIDVTIPVGLDAKGTQVGMGSVIRDAIVRALAGAVTSPLRLVGAIIPRGGEGEVQALLPTPIAFRPGTSELDDRGNEAVERLAAFIASRPGLGVTLSAPPTTADIRGARERRVREELGPRKGLVATLRNVGARGRIVDALDARARGEADTLDADDQKTLDAWVEEQPAPSADELRALGDVRMDAIETRLRERYGLRPEQMRRAKVDGEPGGGEPAVLIELGSVRG